MWNDNFFFNFFAQMKIINHTGCAIRVTGLPLCHDDQVNCSVKQKKNTEQN